MRPRILTVSSAALFPLLLSTVVAQSMVTTMKLSRDELGLVKTSQRITTKLSFPERIKEIICGDLYDPADGRGNFVIQRSDNDLFLKPVLPTGISNLFVKTGENGEYTYSFELLVVPATESFRIVNIVNGHSNRSATSRSIKTAIPPAVTRIDSTFANGADQGALILPGVLPGSDPLTGQPPPVPVGGESNRSGSNPNPDTSSLNQKRAPRVELQSEAIGREVPRYPEAAKEAGVTGEVVVEVVVDEQGMVTAAKAISGPILLRQPAVRAARSWRFQPFRPTKVDGVPVPAVGTITFVFKGSSTVSDSLSQ